MTKKEAKKTVHHKKHSAHKETFSLNAMIPAPIQRETNTKQVLLENFVSLQRVMTNLSLKLDSLTNQISKLLELFEISAKALAEKDFEIERDNKEMVEGINKLIDQNKTIAKGLSLMHERIPNQEPYYPQQQSFAPQPMYPPQQPPRATSYSREIPETPRKQFSPLPKPVYQEPSISEEDLPPRAPYQEENQEFESPFEE